MKYQPNHEALNPVYAICLNKNLVLEFLLALSLSLSLVGRVQYMVL